MNFLRHIRDSFHWLFESQCYNLVFYFVAAGSLSWVAASLHFHGTSDGVILAAVLALVLPMHLVASLAYRLFWLAVPKIAGRYARILLSVTRKTVLTERGQRQVLLAASYGALVTLVLLIGACLSTVVTMLLADAMSVSWFPSQIYVLIVSVETAFLIVLAVIPLVMRYFWLLALGPPRALRYYEKWSCEQTYPVLKRAAAARGIQLPAPH